MRDLIPFLIQHGYTTVFVWVLVETAGFPVPSAPLLITMGALAGLGRIWLSPCIGLGVCAALTADLFWYVMGRRRGGSLLSLLCRISLEPDSCVRQTETLFSRYGARSLLIAKFLPGLSAVSTPLAGVIRMRLPLFLLFDGAGALLWVGSFTLLGYLFGEEFERATVYVTSMSKTLFSLVAVGVAGYVLHRYYLRRRFLRELAVARITTEELKRKMDAGEDVMIVDVRHQLDFEAEPYLIPGALRIPLEQWESNQELPRNREVVLYCT